MTYHLLLGSNMLDPAHQLALAVAEISAQPNVLFNRMTGIELTKPYGKTDQADFCNMALEIESSMKPKELLDLLLSIELKQGRIRGEKWGPRIIDIDILLAEDTVINTESLTIPHYDLHNREFALKLMCQLSPNAVHPILKKTMRELLTSLPGGNR